MSAESGGMGAEYLLGFAIDQESFGKISAELEKGLEKALTTTVHVVIDGDTSKIKAELGKGFTVPIAPELSKESVRQLKATVRELFGNDSGFKSFGKEVTRFKTAAGTFNQAVNKLNQINAPGKLETVAGTLDSIRQMLADLKSMNSLPLPPGGSAAGKQAARQAPDPIEMARRASYQQNKLHQENAARRYNPYMNAQNEARYPQGMAGIERVQQPPVPDTAKGKPYYWRTTTRYRQSPMGPVPRTVTYQQVESSGSTTFRVNSAAEDKYFGAYERATSGAFTANQRFQASKGEWFSRGKDNSPEAVDRLKETLRYLHAERKNLELAEQAARQIIKQDIGGYRAAYAKLEQQIAEAEAFLANPPKRFGKKKQAAFKGDLDQKYAALIDLDQTIQGQQASLAGINAERATNKQNLNSFNSEQDRLGGLNKAAADAQREAKRAAAQAQRDAKNAANKANREAEAEAKRQQREADRLANLAAEQARRAREGFAQKRANSDYAFTQQDASKELIDALIDQNRPFGARVMGYTQQAGGGNLKHSRTFKDSILGQIWTGGAVSDPLTGNRSSYRVDLDPGFQAALGDFSNANSAAERARRSRDRLGKNASLKARDPKAFLTKERTAIEAELAAREEMWHHLTDPSGAIRQDSQRLMVEMAEHAKKMANDPEAKALHEMIAKTLHARDQFVHNLTKDIAGLNQDFQVNESALAGLPRPEEKARSSGRNRQGFWRSLGHKAANVVEYGLMGQGLMWAQGQIGSAVTNATAVDEQMAQLKLATNGPFGKENEGRVQQMASVLSPMFVKTQPEVVEMLGSMYRMTDANASAVARLKTAFTGLIPVMKFTAITGMDGSEAMDAMHAAALGLGKSFEQMTPVLGKILVLSEKSVSGLRASSVGMKSESAPHQMLMMLSRFSTPGRSLGFGENFQLALAKTFSDWEQLQGKDIGNQVSELFGNLQKARKPLINNGFKLQPGTPQYAEQLLTQLPDIAKKAMQGGTGLGLPNKIQDVLKIVSDPKFIKDVRSNMGLVSSTDGKKELEEKFHVKELTASFQLGRAQMEWQAFTTLLATELLPVLVKVAQVMGNMVEQVKLGEGGLVRFGRALGGVLALFLAFKATNAVVGAFSPLLTLFGKAGSLQMGIKAAGAALAEMLAGGITKALILVGALAAVSYWLSNMNRGKHEKEGEDEQQRLIKTHGRSAVEYHNVSKFANTYNLHRPDAQLSVKDVLSLSSTDVMGGDQAQNNHATDQIFMERQQEGLGDDKSFGSLRRADVPGLIGAVRLKWAGKWLADKLAKMDPKSAEYKKLYPYAAGASQLIESMDSRPSTDKVAGTMKLKGDEQQDLKSIMKQIDSMMPKLETGETSMLENVGRGGGEFAASAMKPIMDRLEGATKGTALEAKYQALKDGLEGIQKAQMEGGAAAGSMTSGTDAFELRQEEFQRRMEAFHAVISALQSDQEQYQKNTDLTRMSVDRLAASEANLNSLYQGRDMPNQVLKERIELTKQQIVAQMGLIEALRTEARQIETTRFRAGQIDAASLKFDRVPQPNVPMTGTTGGVSPALQQVMGYAQKFGLKATSTVRNTLIQHGSHAGQPSDHDFGIAADFVGTAEQKRAFALWMNKNHPEMVKQMIYSPLGISNRGGAFGPIKNAGIAAEHYDHLHLAVRGAVFGPGKGGYSSSQGFVSFGDGQYGSLQQVRAAVMKFESSGNPTAVGPLNKDGQRPYGLYQFKPTTAAPYLKMLGKTWAEFQRDPALQTQVFDMHFMAGYNKSGGNINKALGPWEVRPKALALLRGGGVKGYGTVSATESGISTADDLFGETFAGVLGPVHGNIAAANARQDKTLNRLLAGRMRGGLSSPITGIPLMATVAGSTDQIKIAQQEIGSEKELMSLWLGLRQQKADNLSKLQQAEHQMNELYNKLADMQAEDMLDPLATATDKTAEAIRQMDVAFTKHAENLDRVNQRLQVFGNGQMGVAASLKVANEELLVQQGRFKQFDASYQTYRGQFEGLNKITFAMKVGDLSTTNSRLLRRVDALRTADKLAGKKPRSDMQYFQAASASYGQELTPKFLEAIGLKGESITTFLENYGPLLNSLEGGKEVVAAIRKQGYISAAQMDWLGKAQGRVGQRMEGLARLREAARGGRAQAVGELESKGREYSLNRYDEAKSEAGFNLSQFNEQSSQAQQIAQALGVTWEQTAQAIADSATNLTLLTAQSATLGRDLTHLRAEQKLRDSLDAWLIANPSQSVEDAKSALNLDHIPASKNDLAEAVQKNLTDTGQNLGAQRGVFGARVAQGLGRDFDFKTNLAMLRFGYGQQMGMAQYSLDRPARQREALDSFLSSSLSAVSGQASDMAKQYVTSTARAGELEKQKALDAGKFEQLGLQKDLNTAYADQNATMALWLQAHQMEVDLQQMVNRNAETRFYQGALNSSLTDMFLGKVGPSREQGRHMKGENVLGQRLGGMFKGLGDQIYERQVGRMIDKWTDGLFKQESPQIVALKQNTAATGGLTKSVDALNTTFGGTPPTGPGGGGAPGLPGAGGASADKFGPNAKYGKGDWQKGISGKWSASRILGAAGAAYGAYSAGQASGGGVVGALMGGAQGVMMGAAYGPVGMAVGGVLGLLGSILGSSEDHKKITEKIFNQMPRRQDVIFANQAFLPFSAAAGGRVSKYDFAVNLQGLMVSDAKTAAIVGQTVADNVAPMLRSQLNRGPIARRGT